MLKSKRRRAREFAVQGIYEWHVNQGRSIHDIELHMKEQRYFDRADAVLFSQLLRGVLTHPSHYEAMVEGFYDREPNELSPTERAIVLMATYEMVKCPKTPYQVIINEAIEVTKTFGGQDAHKFVNGVLDKLALQCRATEVAEAKQKPNARAPARNTDAPVA